MAPLQILGIIAGNGVYPRLLADAARKAGVKKIVAAAFTDETDPVLAQHVDLIEWMRVGQLNRLLKFFNRTQSSSRDHGRTDCAEKSFRSPAGFESVDVAGKTETAQRGIHFCRNRRRTGQNRCRSFAGDNISRGFSGTAGLIAGAKLSRQEEEDVDLGWKIAKEIARLDIGQTVIVKNGTVVAVEAFEGTNEAIRRGGALAREGAVMVKVAKPNQDMRFDAPVIGVETIRVAAEAKLRVIAVEAGKTLLLERDAIADLADHSKLSIIAR